MSYQTIRYGVRDSIAEIVLDRPDAANTFTAELLAELAQATTELATEESVRAVVLRGAGKNFCFGANVDMFLSAGDGRPRLIRDLVTRFHNAITRLARIEVPVLGVAHGMSVGGGVALLAACDVVIAAESSKFRLGWSGIGLSMDGGATSTLTRILGPRRTLELIYTNRVFTAAEAETWGFANWVVPDAELESRAAKLATELASGPTRALGICKRLVQDSATEAFEAQLEREAITITEVAGTADVDEGCRAFRERRAPRFAGK